MCKVQVSQFCRNKRKDQQKVVCLTLFIYFFFLNLFASLAWKSPCIGLLVYQNLWTIIIQGTPLLHQCGRKICLSKQFSSQTLHHIGLYIGSDSSGCQIESIQNCRVSRLIPLVLNKSCKNPFADEKGSAETLQKRLALEFFPDTWKVCRHTIHTVCFLFVCLFVFCVAFLYLFYLILTFRRCLHDNHMSFILLSNCQTLNVHGLHKLLNSEHQHL